VRALLFDGPGRLRVDERDERPLAPTEVRIRTHAVGICGSDVHGFTGANGRRVPGMIMGHEAAGVVAEVGEDVHGLTVGQGVAVNPAVTCGRCEFCLSGQDHRCPERRLYGCVLDLPGAFADTFVVEALNAVPFDGPAPLEWGALVEPFAVGDHGVGLLEGDLGHGVLVIGGGPIGLGAALSARRRGIARVVLSEPVAHRREIAEALGIETFDPAAGAEPEPFDAAVECVAIPATVEAALRMTRPGGQVAFVGLGETTLPFPVELLVVGERVVRGSFNYSRADFAAVAAWVASGAVDLRPVVEARVDLEGLAHAFGRYADGTSQAMKTLFQPTEAPSGGEV
jgi:threonine dehydrogenase-like Zn-dependent dehydrogenase